MAVKDQTRAGDVQSVHRALDVLEAVARTGELGVTEIARDLDLPVSTVHNLLRTLARRGYLLGNRGRYRLGPSVTAIASRWDPVSLSSLLEPELQQLAQCTGLAAYAATVVGYDAWMMGFQPAPGLISATDGHWKRGNPLARATGRVIVAMTREAEWADFVTRGREAEPSWSTARWYEELKRIAESGISVKLTRGDDGQVTTTVAVPVWGSPQSVICAIGCTTAGRLSADRLTRLRDALWTATIDLSTRLGAQVPLPKPAVPSHPFRVHPAAPTPQR